MTPATPPAPQPFYDEVQARCTAFCRDLLRDVPELEGIAVVPSYAVPQPNVPFAFMLGGQGPLRSPNELMHMATQLHATLQHNLVTIQALIRTYDEQMQQLVKQFEKLHETKDGPPK